MKDQKLLSIIVPCKEEQENVVAFYEACKDAFKKFPKYLNAGIEIIFIDDGSVDYTWEKIAGLCHKKSGDISVRALGFSRNFGKDAAIYAGLENSNSKYAVIIDADLQQPPKLLIPMLDKLESDEDIDCVCYKQVQRSEKALTKFFKKHFYSVIAKASGLQFEDGASDFRMMRSTMVQALINISERGRFTKGIFSWVGFRTEYLEYRAEPRQGGQSNFSTSKLFKYAFNGIFAFSALPLRFATFMGIFIGIAALIYLCVIIFQKIFIGIAVSGYATIVVTLLFLGSVILFSLGLIGEYLARVFEESKKRPIYIIKRKK